MPHECSKAIARRINEPGFVSRFFVGKGIDIGSGTPTLGNQDFLGNYAEQFPRMTSCQAWDIEDGDATHMASVLDETFDFVHSAHCLEHLYDPVLGLKNWYRILKPQGFLIVVIPDEDLYEQGIWPSTYNGDHKVTFTISKAPGQSWSPVSINVVDLLKTLPGAKIQKIQLLDNTYPYTQPRTDKTQGIAECAIEFVVQKN